ncbi:pseudomurein-binding repeat-containing protein [Methanobacterium sp. ACI-7]|uniref:pseudomurein-binding repeat-containing protein n=1 Tax=unclassified Methanobacterium TaxID=2627676 RepID=UPI0039C44C3C
MSSLIGAFPTNQSENTLLKNSNSQEFTINEITDAASRVKTYTENNHRLPTYVEISSKQISMPDLRLMAVCTTEINSGSTSRISLDNINAPSEPSENLNEGDIQKSEYIDMAQRIKTFTDSRSTAPNYVRTSIGNIRFENNVYIYSKILNFYKENRALPNYVSVTRWNNLGPELLPFLEPTNNCESNHVDIISKSSNLISGSTSDYNKATRIFNYVRDNTDYSFYYNTQYGALKTLKNKK